MSKFMNKNGFAPIVIVLVIAAILALGGGALYYTKKKSVLPAAVPPPVPAPLPLPPLPPQPPPDTTASSTDVTAGWKIYRNEKYGFEVEYPTEWSLQEAFYGHSGKELRPAFLVITEAADKHLSGVTIVIDSNIDNLDVKSYVDKFLSANANGVLPVGFDKRFEVRIGDNSGYELYNVTDPLYTAEWIYFMHNDMAYKFEFPSAIQKKNPTSAIGNFAKINKLVHQILSTFKFIPTPNSK